MVPWQCARSLSLAPPRLIVVPIVWLIERNESEASGSLGTMVRESVLCVWWRSW